MTLVASTELLVVAAATGEETTVTAAVGLPYQAPTGEWRCVVRLTGLHSIFQTWRVTTRCRHCAWLHRSSETLLEDVIDKGGWVLDASSRSDYPLDAVFGRVGRGPGAPPAGPSPK